MASRKRSESAWFRWRRKRRAIQDARRLLGEARNLLKKHKKTLKPSSFEQVSSATEALQDALHDPLTSRLHKLMEDLDRLLEKRLGFARKGAVQEYSESIGIAVIIALLLRAFVLEAFKIPSGSMLPTLEVGDHIFVNKFIYGLRVPLTDDVKPVEFGLPKRGEIIVFVYPKDTSKDFIKRVVAIEGDTVELRQNQIYINGKAVPRRRIPGPCTYTDEEEGSERWHPKRCVAFEEELDGTRYRVIQDTAAFPATIEPVKVPKGHVFVMGDNRDNSHDSRFWGTVNGKLIKGKAMIIWWSSGAPEGVRWSRFFDLVHATPEETAPLPGAESLE